MLRHPIIFHPIYKNIIWGGKKIAEYKGVNLESDNVGESWEISSVDGDVSIVAEGEYKGKSLSQLIAEFGKELLGYDADTDSKFPLLVKIIDANRDLSIQVHPDDKLARERHQCNGKTEMWYVVDAAPGAKIFAGLSAPLSPDTYKTHVADDTILDVVGQYESAPHQFYYIPAGLIHAIGAGNLILEIQQTSDITYRVYDYGRVDASGHPRQLHTELAKDAIDYTFPRHVEPTAKEVDSTTFGVVESPYFSTHLLKLSEQFSYSTDASGKSFTILMVVEGRMCLTTPDGSTYSYGRGQTVLLPACIGECVVSGDATVLAILNAKH